MDKIKTKGISLRIEPDPVLREIAVSVKDVNEKVADLIDDMDLIMNKSNGIGLAAPQVGVSKRIIMIDATKLEDTSINKSLIMINPEIVFSSSETAIIDEGCLSLPEIYYEVERAASIKVEYLDEKGKKQTMEADGMLARVIEHEIDHLNGILFIDYLSALKKKFALKKLEKIKRTKIPKLLAETQGED